MNNFSQHLEKTSLDMRGLRCPLPVLKTHKALRTMSVGSVVVVVSDDKAAPKDFRDYCKATGHEWISSDYSKEEQAWHVILRKKG